jgi:hypothetical protein
MGTRIVRIVRIKMDLLVAWRPPLPDFDCDFNMIYLVAIITSQQNHGHQINHIKIIVRKVAARPPKDPF